MEFNASLTLQAQRRVREGSRLISERDYRNNSHRWKDINEIVSFTESIAQNQQKIAREVSKSRRRIVGNGGSGGFPWQKPNKELDPTISVKKYTCVYISPLNPLVTTGLKDLVSGNVTKSTAGVWCCVQPVPAQVTISSVVNYNVPVSPVPGAPSMPLGSPLAGDFDGTNVFWVPIGGAGGGGNIVMYDASGMTSYANGQTVGVASQFTLGGITVLPGTYQLIGSLSVPAYAGMSTTNMIPQIPVPVSGIIYWWPIAAGLVQANSCSTGSSTIIYVNSTGGF